MHPVYINVKHVSMLCTVRVHRRTDKRAATKNTMTRLNIFLLVAIVQLLLISTATLADDISMLYPWDSK